MISIDKFKLVVENTPLISIDFIIENNDGNYLLGKRTNEPACGYWFTLGGRIFKDEKIENAIKRLSKKEFNQEVVLDSLKFHGVYEHFYDNSFAKENISTHYVVLVYKMKLEQNLILPKDEHSQYKYFSYEDMMNNEYVHKYVKDYFRRNNK